MDSENLARVIEPMLVVYASEDRLVSYGRLCELVARHDPTTYARLWPGSGILAAALGQISRRTLKRHGFALTAIVVNKTNTPGKGFRTLCGSRPKLDWYDEQRKALTYYRAERVA